MQYLVHDTRALGKNAGRWTFVTVGNCVCVRGKQVNPTPTQPNPPHPNPPHPIPSQPSPPHPTPPQQNCLLSLSLGNGVCACAPNGKK